MPLYDVNPFPFTQIPYNLLDIFSQLIVYNFSSLFRTEYYVLLDTHFICAKLFAIKNIFSALLYSDLNAHRFTGRHVSLLKL